MRLIWRNIFTHIHMRKRSKLEGYVSLRVLSYAAKLITYYWHVVTRSWQPSFSNTEEKHQQITRASVQLLLIKQVSRCRLQSICRSPNQAATISWQLSKGKSSSVGYCRVTSLPASLRQNSQVSSIIGSPPFQASNDNLTSLSHPLADTHAHTNKHNNMPCSPLPPIHQALA